MFKNLTIYISEKDTLFKSQLRSQINLLSSYHSSIESVLSNFNDYNEVFSNLLKSLEQQRKGLFGYTLGMIRAAIYTLPLDLLDTPYIVDTLNFIHQHVFERNDEFIKKGFKIGFMEGLKLIQKENRLYTSELRKRPLTTFLSHDCILEH